MGGLWINRDDTPVKAVPMTQNGADCFLSVPVQCHATDVCCPQFAVVLGAGRRGNTKNEHNQVTRHFLERDSVEHAIIDDRLTGGHLLMMEHK